MVPGYILIPVFFVYTVVCSGQIWTGLDLAPSRTETAITKTDHNGFTISQTLSAIELSEVTTLSGIFTRIGGTGQNSAPEYGTPSLPVVSKLIEIPPGTEIRYKVLSKIEEIIDLESSGFPHQLYPQQPSVPKREQDRQTELVFLANKYQEDSFSQQNIVEFEELGIMRGRRIGRINISPVLYNPARNQIKISSELEIEINFIRSSTEPVTNNQGHISPFFESLFSGRILNHQVNKTKTYFQGGPVRFVILSDPMFEESLREFVQWKTKKGFKVIELYKGRDGVGETPAEMRATLAELYHAATPDDPAPTFLLIVGDHDQIPAFQSPGHVTDLYYAEYDGNGDYFPDVFYGRFSANNIEELLPQLEKSIMYEKYLFPDPDFLNEAILIAGVDSRFALTHGNGQINYAAENYLNETFGMNTHSWLVPHPPGTAGKIKDLIFNGASIINYTGHGFDDRWENPRFSIDDIPSMINYGKYPLMIGNGCETNKFNIYESFGEALLRAEGKGAVGYIGASNDSYWDEDFYWAVGVGPITALPTFEQTGPGAYDRLFHKNGEPSTEWYVAQGQISQAGNLAVSEASTNSRARYYWEIYHLMGDPSLMIYFSRPDPIEPLYQKTLKNGATELVIGAEPGTYVALSGAGKLVDAKYANNSGVVRLAFDPLAADDYDLVATAENRQPYFGNVRVKSNTEDIIILKSFTLRDSPEIDNGIAGSGKIAGIDLVIEHTGIYPSENLEMTIYCGNNFITLNDTVFKIQYLEPGQEVDVSGVFHFEISPEVTDGLSVIFTVNISINDSVQWVSDFVAGISAPEIEIIRIIVDDSESEKPDGYLMAGEMAIIGFEITNKGSAGISNALITAYDPSLKVIFDSIIPVVNLGTGDTLIIPFRVTADPEIIYGTIVTPEFEIRADGFMTRLQTSLPVNTLYEDFENAGIRPGFWQTDVEKGWYLTSDESRGYYSIRSGNIGHSDTSELIINMVVETGGTISFFKKLSTERKYDFLEFYINDKLSGKWSGMINWTPEEFAVLPGSNSFRWMYVKDQSVSMGLDCVWIDDIFFPAGSFLGNEMDDQKDYSLLLKRLISPQSGADLGNSEVVAVEIENTGKGKINGFEIIYRINEKEPVSEFFTGEINPLENVIFSFDTPADLSNQGIYHLKVSVAWNNEIKTIYDSLYLEIENVVTIIHVEKAMFFVKAYPNPFDSFIYLEFDKEARYPISVRLISSSGLLVYSETLKMNDGTHILNIDTSAFASGIYHLEIAAGTKKEVVRVLRQ